MADNQYTKGQAFSLMKDNPSFRPLYDVDALTEAVKTAIATGNPDPQPPHFCYIGSDGQVIRVSTDTGKEEVVGDAAESKPNGIVITLPKSGKKFTITPSDWEKLMERLEPTTGNDSAELLDTELKKQYQGVTHRLFELSQAMPNDCVFGNKSGDELNPDYIAISADGSFWAILGNYIYPVDIDCGIARYREDECMAIIDGDTRENIPLSRRLVYWNYVMMISDMSGWVITGYRKVYGAVYTLKDARKYLTAMKKECRRATSRFLAKGAVVLEDLAKKFYNPFD